MTAKLNEALEVFNTAIEELKITIEAIADPEKKASLLEGVSDLEARLKETLACLETKYHDNQALGEERNKPETALQVELSGLREVISQLKKGLGEAEKEEASALKRVQVAEKDIAAKNSELAIFEKEINAKAHQAEQLTREIERLAAGLADSVPAPKLEGLRAQFEPKMQFIKDREFERNQQIRKGQKSQQNKELKIEELNAAKKTLFATKDISAPSKRKILEALSPIQACIDEAITDNIELNIRIGNIVIGERDEINAQAILKELNDQRAILTDALGQAERSRDVALGKALSAEAVVAARSLELATLQENAAITKHEAAEEQLRATEEQLKAAEEQLKAAEQRGKSEEQRLEEAEQRSKAAKQRLDKATSAARTAKNTANAWIKSAEKEKEDQSWIPKANITDAKKEMLQKIQQQAELENKKAEQAQQELEQIQKELGEQDNWSTVIAEAPGRKEQATEEMQKAKKLSLEARKKNEQYKSEAAGAKANKEKAHIQRNQASDKAAQTMEQARQAIERVSQHKESADAKKHMKVSNSQQEGPGVLETKDNDIGLAADVKKRMEVQDSPQGRKPEGVANNKKLSSFSTAYKALGVLMAVAANRLSGGIASTYMREGIASIGNFFTCYTRNNNLSSSAQTCWDENLGKTMATAAVILISTACLIKYCSKKPDRQVLVESGAAADASGEITR